MDRDVVREAVRAAIESIAPGVDPGALHPGRPVREQVDLDSLDWFNVLEALQERLSVRIPESDYGRLSTLDEIVDYVASRRAKGAGVPTTALEDDGRLPPSARHVIDGATVTVRPLCREDLELEADFVRGLSSEARYKRFMATVQEVSRAKLASLTDVDQVRNVALAAVVNPDGRQAIVGVARYSLDSAGGCEFAVTVADAWQGSGLAGILMRALIGVARRRGVRTMEGIVLRTNARMLKLARQLGFSREPEPGSRETVRVVRCL